VVGTRKGEFIRRSLNFVNWEKAERLLRDWEVEDSPPVERLTLELATERFLKDCEARHLREATLGKYRLLFKELNRLYGKYEVSRIGVDELDYYRSTWKLAAISSRKKLERLRAFFRFCVDRDWVRKNPAVLLKSPIVTSKPTLPFTPEEMERIIWACEVYPTKGIYGAENKSRMRAFVLLLRHSGLRIGDAVCLEKSRISEGKLFLYTQKTGVPVWLPLPDECLDALEKMRSSSAQYFFWSGTGNKKSAIADWQRALGKLSVLSGVHVHAHRFRDSYAVGLLEAGVPLDQVSILLGHADVKVTFKHYAPWVRSRQIQLESAVKQSWNRVP
jgi:integrase